MREAQIRIADLAVEIPLYNVTKLDAVPASLQGFKGNPDQCGSVLERARVGAQTLAMRSGPASRPALAILRRLATAVPLLLIVSVVVFALIHAAPGGPTAVFLANPGVRPEDIERLQRALGLDQPVWVQYARWLGAFVRGDWGYSLTDNRAVLDRVLERTPATLELAAASIGMAFVATFALATGAALTRGRWPDRVVRAASAAGLAIPAFWFGLVLQLVFAASLGWLPSSGRVTPGDGSVIDRVPTPRAARHGARHHPRRGLDALPARVDGRGIRSAVRHPPPVHAGFRSEESSCDTSCARRSFRWSPWSCSTQRCSSREPSSPRACSPGRGSARCSPRRWPDVTMRC